MVVIEMKPLKEIARIYDKQCLFVKGLQRILRKGPYRLYVEDGWVPFDDFIFDGYYLLLGSICNVRDAAGNLTVIEARGKFWSTDLYHVIACDNEEDTAYLYEVLSRTPAVGYAAISGFTERLSLEVLKNIQVPWPNAQLRKQTLSFFRKLRSDIATDLNRLDNLFDQGIEEYRKAIKDSSQKVSLAELCEIHKGSNLGTPDRLLNGKTVIMSSQGRAGYTNKPGIKAPSIILGQAGQFIVGFPVTEKVYPLKDTVALTIKDQGFMSLDGLIFALGFLGVLPRLQLINNRVKGLSIQLQEVDKLEVYLVEDGKRIEWLCNTRRLSRLRTGLRRSIRRRQKILAEFAQNLIRGEDLQNLPSSSIIPAEQVSADKAKEMGSILIRQSNYGTFCNQIKNLLHVIESKISDVSSPVDVSFEAVWELLPIVFLRMVCKESLWQETKTVQDPILRMNAEFDRLATQKDDLSFLGNLTLRSSLLSHEAQLQLIKSVASLSLPKNQGSFLRQLSLEYTNNQITGEKPLVCRHPDALYPEEVLLLLAKLAFLFSPGATSAFDLCIHVGELTAALKKLSPTLACSGQSEVFSNYLVSIMSAYCERWVYNSLTLGSLDQTSAIKNTYDLVVSVLPPNEAEWSRKLPDADDKRWIFGVPPRNRANLAWFQAAMSLIKEEGFAVLLLSNAFLHESRGCEPSVRASIIESGCIRAVISLPGRLFEDDRAPMSIIVAGKPREGSCETLFITAEEGATESRFGQGFWLRSLSESSLERICDAVSKFVKSGTCPSLPGFVRCASKDEIRTMGDLTSWSFVQQK